MEPFINLAAPTPSAGRLECVWVPGADGRLECIWVPGRERERAETAGEPVEPVRRAS